MSGLKIRWQPRPCQSPVRQQQGGRQTTAYTMLAQDSREVRNVGGLTGEANQLLARSVCVWRAPLNRMMHARPPSLATWTTQRGIRKNPEQAHGLLVLM